MAVLAIKLFLIWILLCPESVFGQFSSCGDGNKCSCQGSIIVCTNLKANLLLDIFTPQVLRNYKSMIVKDIACSDIGALKGLLTRFEVTLLIPKRCHDDDTDDDKQDKDYSTDDDKQDKDYSTDLNINYENYEQVMEHLPYDNTDVTNSNIGEIMGYTTSGLFIVILGLFIAWCIKTGKCTGQGYEKVKILIIIFYFALKTSNKIMQTFVFITVSKPNLKSLSRRVSI